MNHIVRVVSLQNRSDGPYGLLIGVVGAEVTEVVERGRVVRTAVRGGEVYGHN